MRSPDLPAVFTTSDARKAGVGEWRLRGLVDSGHVQRLRRGLYAVKEPPPVGAARATAYRALVLASGAAHGQVDTVSHLSAAALHGLPLPLGRLDTVHVTRVSGWPRGWRARGLWVHHADSTEASLELVDGVLVTSVARTVADCLRAHPPRVSVPIADAALHRGLVTGREVWDEIALQCHWVGRVLRTDVALPLVDGRRESWLESYAAVLFHEWGIDPPVPQLLVLDDAQRFVARVDAGWEEDATVLEIDGSQKYLLPQSSTAQRVVDPHAAFRAEKARYDALGNLGLERVRFGLDDLLKHRARVERHVRDRRGHGSRARFTGRFERLPALTIPWF
ncbi:type IV toxin-antitoxin system AbiEi family antitoxin domain-containing protein [Dermatophilaceae bacterium Soc4.6]